MAAEVDLRSIVVVAAAAAEVTNNSKVATVAAVPATRADPAASSPSSRC